MSMRRRVIGALRWLALAPALLALAPAAAHAADLRQGPEVTIPAGVTVADDLYAGAGQVSVAGTIAGSLIAAGGTVDVAGTVERDLMALGGTVTISGPVMGERARGRRDAARHGAGGRGRGPAVGHVLAALFLGRSGFRLIGRPEAHPLLALLAGLAVATPSRSERHEVAFSCRAASTITPAA